MTLRDAFEKWISLPPFEHMCEINGNKSAWPGAYKRYETELAWEAYQAAHAKQQKRVEELEELLKLVDAAFRGCNIDMIAMGKRIDKALSATAQEGKDEH